MPKMKTHRGAAKRVKITGTGKIKRHHAYASHKLGCKTMKQTRNLRKSVVLSSADSGRFTKLLPYAK